MKLQITVINWNTKDLLRGCLRSIEASGVVTEHRLQVVDNASSDGSVDMVRAEFPRVSVVANPRNEGYSHAANQALLAGEQVYDLILNGDTDVQPGCVDALVRFLDENPRAAVAGPLLLNTDRTIQYSGRRFPSFAQAFVHAFFGVLFPDNRWSRRYRLSDWDRERTTRVDWISGAAMLLRTGACRAVGGFDETFFMYVEDLDLCWRLRQAGHGVFLVPEARAVHYSGQSSRLAPARTIREFQKSLYRFFVKQNRGTPKILLAPLVAAGLAARGVLLLLLDRLGVRDRTGLKKKR
jgi:GT2 family glycosyltransferase